MKNFNEYKRFTTAEEAVKKDCKFCIYCRAKNDGVFACDMRECPAEGYDVKKLFNKKSEIKDPAGWQDFVKKSILRE